MAAKLDANGGSEPLRATRRQKSNDKRPSPGGGRSARLRPIARIDDVARTDGTGNRQMPAKVTAKTGNTHAAEPQCAPEAIAAHVTSDPRPGLQAGREAVRGRMHDGNAPVTSLRA